ncbi:hypothetical protein DBR17_01770 [Sphingomonas sp. HMWF008]|nr:hypothetical protein DBR17_01770 [Sphingomonas sp. HMWF008]
MQSLVTRLTLRAPTILFIVSAIIFVAGVVAAVMTASLTIQQVQHGLPSGATSGADGVARLQLLVGIVGAFQNAVWPFAAGALVRAIQSKPVY